MITTVIPRIVVSTRNVKLIPVVMTITDMRPTASIVATENDLMINLVFT